jgi:anti-sigma B factor antagonist
MDPGGGITAGDEKTLAGGGGGAVAWYRGDDRSRPATFPKTPGVVAFVSGRVDMASIDHWWESPGVLVIKVSGEVDLANVERLLDKVEAVVQSAPKLVIFDLAELEFIDSSGLALLVTIANDAGQAQLRHPSAIVQRVVNVTGLSGLLPTER